MPYEVTFSKKLDVDDPEPYINECCYGGDVVAEVIANSLGATYGELDPVQEDWGWLIWITQNNLKLEINISCNDKDAGDFQIHLVTKAKHLFFSTRIADTHELEVLREAVVKALTTWLGKEPEVTRLNTKFLPT
jgi:hypothetical protein